MFEFLMQSIYMLLLVMVKNEKLATDLKQYLPKKKILLSWLDVFTELMFMQ